MKLAIFWSVAALSRGTASKLTQATVIFVLGLISEQIAAMRFERGEGTK